MNIVVAIEVLIPTHTINAVSLIYERPLYHFLYCHWKMTRQQSANKSWAYIRSRQFWSPYNVLSTANVA